MDERNFFVVEKNRLIPLRQYEATLNHLSPLRRLINKFNYDSNMGHAESKIWHAIKRGQPVCCLEYPDATEEEVKDIIARLKYMEYNVDFYYIGPHLGSEIRVRLDGNQEGIDYVSY